MTAFDVLEAVDKNGRVTFSMRDFHWITFGEFDREPDYLRELIMAYLHPIRQLVSFRFQRQKVGYKEAQVKREGDNVSFKLAPVLLLPAHGLEEFERFLRFIIRFMRDHEGNSPLVFFTNNRDHHRRTFGKVHATYALDSERREPSDWQESIQQYVDRIPVLRDWLQSKARDLNILGPWSRATIDPAMLLDAEELHPPRPKQGKRSHKEEEMTSIRLNIVKVQTVMTMENARVNMMAYLPIPNITKLPDLPSDPEIDVGDGPEVGSILRVFRHYPLTELEARSLHFKGSSPLKWIEEHMGDLLKLALFDAGFDARQIDRFEFEYVPFLVQEEESDPRAPLQQHVYQWTFNKDAEELTLTDNGDVIIAQSTKGPQAYVHLHEEEQKIRALAVRPQAVTETIRKD